MKKHPEHKIDALLHDSLHDLRGETSAQDWAEIQRRLQQEQKDKPFFWLMNGKKWFGVLAMLLLLSFAGIGYFNLTRSTQTIAQTTLTEIKNADQLKAKKQKETITNTNENITANNNTNLAGDDIAGNKISSDKNGNNRTLENKKSNKITESFSAFNRSFKLLENTKKQVLGNPDKLDNESNIFSANDNNNAAKSRTRAIIDNNSLDNLTPNESILAAQDSIQIDEDKTLAKSKSGIKNTPADKVNTGKKTNKTFSGFTKKLSFGFSFSPEFSSGKLDINSSKAEQVHKDFYDLRNDQEKPSTAYNTSIFAQYNIWGNLNIQSGIAYYKQTETVHYKFYNNNIPVIDSASRNILGYIEIEDTIGTNYNGRNSYNYISIPLNIEYNFPLSAKLTIAFQAGGSAMFSSGAKGQTLRSDDLTLTEINNLRKTNFSVAVSPAIYYKLQKCFSIGLQTTYSQLLNPVQNQSSTIRIKPWNIGAGVNLRFMPF